ncbi:hypothetical protein [Capnocytophaga sp. oral taxon 878]|uniref:hypothetical protein n=1 Tax=Capnocytophaga sp. oral taxon 878 TaxID=1316596 RepID=UPI000D03696D|nr:hypothetical protein [Capnocytophaga sp. oral taxon 878]AVM50547.1 hypothetical protein C4H12_08690 [Capnocytophaga sp. oral taxon 878]
MNFPFSYSYFGKDSEKIVFELDNTPFTVDIESKNIKNQVVICHNTTFNDEFLSAFGEETYQKTLTIHKKVTHFKVKHPIAKINNTLFSSTIQVEKIHIRSFSDTIRTTFIYIETQGEILQQDFKVLAHSLNFLTEMGFVIINKEKLPQYLSLQSLPSDLSPSIETTNISEILAHKGLMYIVWGFIPAYYRLIVTQASLSPFPIGKQVGPIGYGIFSEPYETQAIITGESLECIYEEPTLCNSFNNAEYKGFSVKFYVSGRMEGNETYEALNAYIHIELHQASPQLYELDLIDPKEIFNNEIDNEG